MMSEIFFGNQKLLESQRICCYNSDSLKIKYSFDPKSVLEINFRFIYNDAERGYTVESTENGTININIYNFNNPLGTGLKKPQPLGKYKDREISIVFFISLPPDANPILDYSLFMEVKNA